MEHQHLKILWVKSLARGVLIFWWVELIQRRNKTWCHEMSRHQKYARGDPLQVYMSVSYANKQYFVGYCWRVVKPFIAVLMLYSSSAVVLWGVPYIGWAQTCMGLTMAGACAKHQPCYWSQISLLLTKNSKKSLYLNFTLALLALHFNILPLDFNLL